MSLQGFRCPEHTPTMGNNNDIGHCLNICPHRCMPIGILHTIFDQQATNVHKGDIVTPTSLPRCPRKLKLERTRPYYAEPQKMYWATRGGLYHGWFERPLPGVMTETRLWKQITFGPLTPYWMSAAFDAYILKERRLEDYKSQADKGIYYLFDQGHKEDHEEQLNVYRWFMHGGQVGTTLEEALDHDPVFWPVDSLVVNHVYMMQVISTGSTFFFRENTYRPHKVFKLEVGREQVGKTKTGCPIWEYEIKLPPIPIWPFTRVEAVIADRAPTLVRAFREPEWIPDGVMHDSDKLWECKLCPVERECALIEGAKQPSLFEDIT